MPQPVLVKRPPLLILAVLILAASGVALGAGLAALSARRAAMPAVVAIDKQDLADALGDSPWTSSDEDQSDKGDDDNNQVLWYLTAPDCPACRAFERTTMERLIDSGVEVRAIVVAPRSAPAGSRAARDAAALSKARDWTGLHLWMQGKREAPGEQLDPAEEDGLLEWGRQSGERIAAALRRNDLGYGAPALFWMNGPEWRASVNTRPDMFGEIERQLAPKA